MHPLCVPCSSVAVGLMLGASRPSLRICRGCPGLELESSLGRRRRGHSGARSLMHERSTSGRLRFSNSTGAHRMPTSGTRRPIRCGDLVRVLQRRVVSADRQLRPRPDPRPDRQRPRRITLGGVTVRPRCHRRRHDLTRKARRSATKSRSHAGKRPRPASLLRGSYTPDVHLGKPCRRLSMPAQSWPCSRPPDRTHWTHRDSRRSGAKRPTTTPAPRAPRRATRTRPRSARRPGSWLPAFHARRASSAMCWER